MCDFSSKPYMPATFSDEHCVEKYRSISQHRKAQAHLIQSNVWVHFGTQKVQVNFGT